MSLRPLLLIGMLAASVVAATASCSTGQSTARSTPVDMGHVHELVVDDGRLYAATHAGLFEIGPGRASAVGDAAHDLMALAVGADGTLLASGHPDLRVEDLVVDGRPPLLGLAESNDKGTTWTSVSLLGEADFHSLTLASYGILGVDGASGSLLVSSDGVAWQQRGTIDGVDLAVDPDNDERLVAVTYEGAVVASNDGGWSWEPLDAPLATSIEWPESGPLTLGGEDGVIHTTDQVGDGWTSAGDLGEEIESLLAADGTLFAATEGGKISTSVDGGTTWVRLGGP
mgnify:CR=1 FL=1